MYCAQNHLKFLRFFMSVVRLLTPISAAPMSEVRLPLLLPMLSSGISMEMHAMPVRPSRFSMPGLHCSRATQAAMRLSKQAGAARSFPQRLRSSVTPLLAGLRAAISRFENRLRNVSLPEIINGDARTNGNGELAMIDASFALSVFLDDQVSFNKAVAMWRARVPVYFYLTSDGLLPHPPPGAGPLTNAQIINYWQGQSTFVNGLSQETCRDFMHTQYGFSAPMNGAEIAWNQGVDLYGAEASRITAAMEFHAGYLLGKPVPSWFCHGRLKLSFYPTWEIAFNHYHNVLKMALPLSQQLILTHLRSTGVVVNKAKIGQVLRSRVVNQREEWSTQSLSFEKALPI